MPTPRQRRGNMIQRNPQIPLPADAIDTNQERIIPNRLPSEELELYELLEVERHASVEPQPDDATPGAIAWFNGYYSYNPLQYRGLRHLFGALVLTALNRTGSFQFSAMQDYLDYKEIMTASGPRGTTLYLLKDTDTQVLFISDVNSYPNLWDAYSNARGNVLHNHVVLESIETKGLARVLAQDALDLAAQLGGIAGYDANKNIAIFGHGYGGNLAQALGFLLKGLNPTQNILECVAYGSLLLATDDFWRAVDDRDLTFWTYISPNDFAYRMPFSTSIWDFSLCSRSRRSNRILDSGPYLQLPNGRWGFPNPVYAMESYSQRIAFSKKQTQVTDNVSTTENIEMIRGGSVSTVNLEEVEFPYVEKVEPFYWVGVNGEIPIGGGASPNASQFQTDMKHNHSMQWYARALRDRPGIARNICQSIERMATWYLDGLTVTNEILIDPGLIRGVDFNSLQSWFQG